MYAEDVGTYSTVVFNRKHLVEMLVLCDEHLKEWKLVQKVVCEFEGFPSGETFGYKVA
jgi:hypothetical protein